MKPPVFVLFGTKKLQLAILTAVPYIIYNVYISKPCENPQRLLQGKSLEHDYI